jgi:hypothetical protein
LALAVAIEGWVWTASISRKSVPGTMRAETAACNSSIVTESLDSLIAASRAGREVAIRGKLLTPALPCNRIVAVALYRRGWTGAFALTKAVIPAIASGTTSNNHHHRRKPSRYPIRLRGSSSIKPIPFVTEARLRETWEIGPDLRQSRKSPGRSAAAEPGKHRHGPNWVSVMRYLID